MTKPEMVHLAKGTEEFLQYLRRSDIPFALASASIMSNIDFYFETFGLDRWFKKEQVVYDDGTYPDKGSMHLEAARRLNASITDCLLIEDSPGSIRLFQLVRNPGKTGASDDTAVRYNDTDDWPAQPPVGIYFNYGLVDEFMREWLLRQQELHAGEITRDEYFEWKLNWPCTCDDSKRFDYYVPWKKEK